MTTTKEKIKIKKEKDARPVNTWSRKQTHLFNKKVRH